MKSIIYVLSMMMNRVYMCMYANLCVVPQTSDSRIQILVLPDTRGELSDDP